MMMIKSFDAAQREGERKERVEIANGDRFYFNRTKINPIESVLYLIIILLSRFCIFVTNWTFGEFDYDGQRLTKQVGSYNNM